MHYLLIILLLVCSGSAETVPRNRFTFSAGWSRSFPGAVRTITGIGVSYGYRLHPHIEAEAGVFTALQPRPDIRGARYFLDPDDRFVWVPFGIRFVSKMHGERLEFSGGGGGLYEKYHVSNPNWGFGVLSRSGWGGYLVGSAAVALDKQGHHYWLGVTPRWFLANSGSHRDRWLQLSGEFSVRW